MKKLLFISFFISIISFCQEKAEFSIKLDSAKKVYVTGSFNSWSHEGIELKKNGKVFSTKINLPSGWYYYKFIVDGNWIPDPNNPLKVNDGGTSFNSIIKVGNPKIPDRKKRKEKFDASKLPEPILTNDPELVKLYYKAWEMNWKKITKGNSHNGFVEEYLDEGFDEMIYQWDTCFMILFAMYNNGYYSSITSLDNFYNKQRDDGYIQCVYNGLNGKIATEPTKDEPMVNPPLFSFVEWKYYELTGDQSRFVKVLPVLVKYFYWLENNCTSKNKPYLYYTTPLGSGMDNVPRNGVNQGGWIDFSAQQALAAEYISNIAQLIGNKKVATEFILKAAMIKSTINTYCWNESYKYYFDLKENSTLSSTIHIGAYWNLLSNTADLEKTKSMVNYLNSEKHFNTKHRIPAISKINKEYDGSGHYWLGGVWAPTNYMVIKGLENYGYFSLADEITENHLRNMLLVYRNGISNDSLIAYEERYSDGYNTIWECYSPEKAEPATRWDDTYFSRQDFVGWSGLGPIALLIENVIGLKVNGYKNSVDWRIKRTDEHGLKNFKLGADNLISLKCTDKKLIDTECIAPFKLNILVDGKVYEVDIPKGKYSFELEL